VLRGPGDPAFENGSKPRVGSRPADGRDFP
jgi:hypothetical protein